MQYLTNNASLGNLNAELLNVELSDQLKNARSYLISLVTSPDFVVKMQVAFGNSFDLQKVEELAASWGRADFGSFPQIEMRDASEINNARGAFAAATNTIYLSREFVRENEGNGSAIASVLLEEYGHYIDSQINAIDSAGDEGEIFAALAQDKVLSESELTALKGEDDSAIALLDGKEIVIEQANTKIIKDSLNFFASNIGDWTDINLFNKTTYPFPFFNETFEIPSGKIDTSFIKYDWDFKTNLKGYGFIELGNLGISNFSYPLNIGVEVPNNLSSNETFLINPGIEFNLDPAATIKESKGLQFPNAGIKFEIEQESASINNLEISNPFGYPIEIDNLDFKKFAPKLELGLDTNELLNKLLQLDLPLGLGNISVSVPEIEELKPIVSPNSGGALPGIAASGKSENIINLQGDIDAIAALLVPGYAELAAALNPLPFFKLSLSGLGFSLESPEGLRNKIQLSADILDIDANLGFALQQDFVFHPLNVNVIMSVDGQLLHTGSLGSPFNGFEFKTPSEGTGVMTVKARYELFGNVTNNIGVVFQGSLDTKVLEAGVELEFFKLPLIKGKIGPLFSQKLPKDGFTSEPFPLLGSYPNNPGDPDSLFKILKSISTSEIQGTEAQNDDNPEAGATKNIVIEKIYKIPYNMPFFISDVNVAEGDLILNNAVFTVTLRQVSDQPVTIAYSTTDGTAIAGTDYVATNGTITIPAGELNATIDVPIVSNTRRNPNKTFTLSLQNPDGTPFAEGVPTIDAIGTIIDDDAIITTPEDYARTFNDPRIITFDKQYHDFQATGEFTLLESTSGDLKIQVRQEPIDNDPLTNVSENSAVATMLDGKRIGIYKDRGLLIDGNPVNISDKDSMILGKGRIYREGNVYTIVYSGGDQLVAKVLPKRININVYLTKEHQGKISGLLGNFNNDPKDDFAKPDGTIPNQPVPIAQLYGEYADSWRITQGESLFDYKPGEDTNTFTNKNYPRQKVTLKDLNPADVQTAEERIGDLITDPTIREATIIDYILTGFDETIIEDAIASPIPESILIIAIPPRGFEDFASTKVNTPVKINVLSNDEGTIGVPLAIANFDSTTTKGSIISIDDNKTPDDRTDDQLIYTPTANFTGNDTFNYTITDGKDSSTAKVTVFVNPPLPPLAAEDFSSTNVNIPVKIDVLSNDISSENLPLTIANFDQTSTAGSIIRLDDNNTLDDKTDDQLIYTPTANFTGNDTFNYTVTDGTQTSTAKVTVNIATFNLSNLNGSNGFTLNGINPGNFAGVSVNTLKDFNGDGFNDFIIGAFAADPNNNNAAGETYVLFGKQGGFPASIDLPKLDGSNGFILNGIDTNSFSGGSVSSAGDINKDGLDDIVIGAFGATANGQNNAGKAYVVFGAKGVYPARLNLSDLNGNNGFVVNGVNEFDYLGLAVSSAGDINADSIDDLLISAPGPLNGTVSKSYVIYGRKGTFTANLNSSDINGSNGFVINDNDGKSGTSVSAAGDINGDGIDDIIINAEENDSNNYVIFGSANGFAANFNLSELNGSNGFILDTGNEKSGTTVSKAGDINGDTIDDLIISLASSNSTAGKAYILFGNNQGFAPRLDLSQFNGKNGFALVSNLDGNSISAISGAGDINGDGIDDLAIATSQANLNAGKTYILFGDNAGFTPSFYLSRINGTNGFVINGIKENDLSGTSLSQGGDINGDNIDDLVIGSPGNLFNNSPGQTHVVFGSTLFGSDKDTSNLAKLLFDSRYYLNQNPDVREAVSSGLFHNAFEHFIKFGVKEGREPSAKFAGDYLTNNPDVVAAVNTGILHSGFEHFIKFGFAERRQSDSIFGALADLEVFYRSENPDVVSAIQQGIISSGLEHLIQFGMLEGRLPFSRFAALSKNFDADFYLTQNQDVKQAVDRGYFRSALEHFAKLGLFEGRDPGSQFSNSSYLTNYPDVAAAISSGFLRSGYEHFINYGFGEERVGVAIDFA